MLGDTHAPLRRTNRRQARCLRFCIPGRTWLRGNGRYDRTDGERAYFLALRKDAYLRQFPETKHGTIGNSREKSRQNGDSTSDDPKPERFTNETARIGDMSERTIQRSLERAKNIRMEDAV
jgi:hypothetical protein